MEKSITFVTELMSKMVAQVVASLVHNWIPLSLAILTAVIMSVYINPEKLKKALLRKPKVSILASVAFGAFTPLCACGTMAVVIGMFTTTLPWGPIMAFLTSSPLMSPDGFILLAGVVGIKFAVAVALSSIIIGLGSGFLTHIIETKTSFLKNQTRFSKDQQPGTCGCSGQTVAAVQTCACFAPTPTAMQACCCCDEASVPLQACCVVQKSDNIFAAFLRNIKWHEMAEAFVKIGLKQILLYFSIFVAIGYLINYFVPTSFIIALFSPKSIFSVPLAALIGLPLYVTGESAIPLINALITGGAGGGSMLAFMITGPATSAWVIAGITVFMKRRVIGLYIAYILTGAILLGYLYDLVLAIGIM